jgi:replication-associated recombination protein RarA
MANLDSRIEVARERLREALLSGQPTGDIRAALASLEKARDVEQARQRAATAEQDQARREWIDTRADQLADEHLAAVSALIERFPVPAPPPEVPAHESR